ncbi:alpha/beta fold hydrolase [Roseobacteraceae bacterium S113]
MVDAVVPTDEGALRTARLTVHHLAVTRPHAPKVLFLGGSNFDLRLKRSFLGTELARHCNLVTYEPRGIGRTQQPDGRWTMEDYARDALAVLDAVGWERASILGESFGGMTGLHVAQLAPERVSCLVVASATAGGPVHASYDISSFLDLPLQEAAEQALCLQDTRHIALRDTDPDAFAQALEARIAFETAFRDPSVDTGGYRRLLDARRGHDCTDALSAIETPTHVIAGRFDKQARPDAQSALVAALPNGSLDMFDAGHGVVFADPMATQSALRFIRAHSPPKENMT